MKLGTVFWMSTALTIRSRRSFSNVRRPASLSSLPDLSDNLEIGSRPSSGTSVLFDTWSHAPAGSDNNNCQSNISVSFLGCRIQRQYRSAFLLGDEHVVGVSRSETFHPEKSQADVRVNLSVQGPQNESLVSSQRRSQSASNLIRDNLDENCGWPRLLLTTDRPRDSEIVGRIGSRNYFTKGCVNSPHFHRRILPMKKEEEYIIGVTTLRENSESYGKNETVSSTLVSGTASDGEPSVDRFEKETVIDATRSQANLSSVAAVPVISPSPHVSLSDKGK